MKHPYYERGHEDKGEKTTAQRVEDRSSGVEHLSESTGIRGEGERPNSVTGSHRPYFVVNSERTEEDGGGAQALGGFEECIGTIGMIAVDQHRNWALLPDCIIDAFQPVDELRLETVQLHH